MFREGFLTEYSVGNIIGKGAFGTVYCVAHIASGENRAAKFIPASEDANEEALIHQSLHHPNIVSVFDVFRTEDAVVIVMPLVDGGDLFSKIAVGPMPESEARRIFSEVLRALSYLREHLIFHGDIKLENILLDRNGSPLLIDFGFSQRIRGATATNCRRWGSPNYMAPEILRSTRSCSADSLPSKYGAYGCEADVWAAGVALFAAIVGQYPFHDECNASRHRRIVERAIVPLPSACQLSADVIHLLYDCMLVVSPSQRWTANQIVSNHPFFSGVGVRSNRKIAPATSSAADCCAAAQ